MSEPASQPGAPADGAQKQDFPVHEKVKSVAKEVEKKMPPQVVSKAKGMDRVVLRLNKYA